MPIMDKSQDWQLLYGEENEFGTVLKFVRRINTCDDAEDVAIQVKIDIIFVFLFFKQSSNPLEILQKLSRLLASVRNLTMSL